MRYLRPHLLCLGQQYVLTRVDEARQVPPRNVDSLLENIGAQQGTNYFVFLFCLFAGEHCDIYRYLFFSRANLQRFRTYLLETNRVLDILVILLYFCMEYKQDPSKYALTVLSFRYSTAALH